MDEPTTGPKEATRLEAISTQWSLLRLAQDTGTAAEPARNALALRYARAIRKYLGALVGDAHDADDLAQEAVVRILRGQFAQADPDRGRFRDYLKAALRNLVRTLWTRQQRRLTRELEKELIGPAAAPDDVWIATWREALLEQTWMALEHLQRQQPGNLAHTLLRLRADYPEDDIDHLAKRLARATGRPMRPDAVRQQLRRARLRFAELLLEELARTMERPTPEGVEIELAELGLMDYVRDFLPDDWRQRGELKAEVE
jgi:RNA polymerase sigma-70 factor (ECF subfamily)